MDLPDDLWHLVYDYLDDVSLWSYHNTTRSLRKCLPSKFPIAEFMMLSKIQTEVLNVKDRESKSYIRSIPYTPTDSSDIERLINKITHMRKSILNHVIAYSDTFSWAWEITMIDVLQCAYSKDVKERSIKTKRWYHSPVTSTYVFPHKRQVSGEPFFRPGCRVVDERIVPPPLKQEHCMDKGAVFDKVKWFCGKSYSTSHNRSQIPGFTYRVLSEDELRDSFSTKKTFWGSRVPFTKWHQDGDWWAILLVDLETGVRTECRKERPDWTSFGVTYHDSNV